MEPFASPAPNVADRLPIPRRARAIWAIAVAATLADAVTTALGIGFGIPERNPVVAEVLAAAGIPGFLVLKAVSLLAVAAVGARYFDRPTVAPAVLAVVWGGVATLNAVVLVLA